MKRFTLSALLMLAGATVAKVAVAMPTVPARVAVVDRVVVGKVARIAARTIAAELYPKDARPMLVATVEVSDAVLGAKMKEVQVGYLAPVALAPGGRPGRRVPAVELSVGDEAVFYLAKHPTKLGLLVAQNYYDVSRKAGRTDFVAEVEAARKAAKVVADPDAALQAKDAESRAAASLILLTRYRTGRPGSKLLPLSAEESKRLLLALAEADWARSRDLRISPAAAFAGLGLTAKDGWNAPENYDDFPRDAKRWLRDNAGKHRVQRHVWPAPEEPEPAR